MKPTATTKTIKRREVTRLCILGLFYLIMVAVVACLLATSASAQGSKKKEDDEKYKPRAVTLKTKDGVSLRAFYFPNEKGKEATTVLLVHEWLGQATPYAALVKALRDSGCAVLIPDYRGHGGSQTYTDAKGKEKKYNLATMGKRDVENIIVQDLEEAKRFLKKENNAEQLNMNALVVIGIREGCVIGTHWTQRDWSFAPVGAKKRGQDVKALVLISPKKVVKGISIDKALGPAVLNMPILLVAGRGSSEESEAKRLHKRIEVVKKRVQQTREAPDGLSMRVSKASLSGPRLAQSPDAIKAIVQFVNAQVNVSDDENPWVMRD